MKVEVRVQAQVPLDIPRKPNTAVPIENGTSCAPASDAEAPLTCNIVSQEATDGEKQREENSRLGRTAEAGRWQG